MEEDAVLAMALPSSSKRQASDFGEGIAESRTCEVRGGITDEANRLLGPF